MRNTPTEQSVKNGYSREKNERTTENEMEDACQRDLKVLCSEQARRRTGKSHRNVVSFQHCRKTYRNRQTHTYTALINPTLYPRWTFVLAEQGLCI